MILIFDNACSLPQEDKFLNLVNIIASKVQDNSYISFLGYTYVNIESDNKELDLEKGDFVLVDLIYFVDLTYINIVTYIFEKIHIM